MILRFLYLVAIVSLSACATMDEEECNSADWQAIGYEDGAQGHALSYMGNHRKACADYGISPDFERYKQGRLAGLQEYCVPATAFALGRAGGQFNASCTPSLAPDFEQAWSHGRELHRAESQLRVSEQALKKHLSWLEHLTLEIQEAEAILVSDGLSRRQRKEILTDLKDLGEDLAKAEYELSVLEDQLMDDQGFVGQVQARYDY